MCTYVHMCIHAHMCICVYVHKQNIGCSNLNWGCLVAYRRSWCWAENFILLAKFIAIVALFKFRSTSELAAWLDLLLDENTLGNITACRWSIGELI